MNPKKKSTSKRPAQKKSAPQPDAPAVVAPQKPAAPRPPFTLKVPSILLEDDAPPPEIMARLNPPKPVAPPPAPTAPVLPTVLPVEPPPAPTLPLSYGTRQLSLLARDPFTLYADWDFSTEELEVARQVSSKGQVVLRVFRDTLSGPMVLEIPVVPGQRHQFIPAPLAGTAYFAQLGFVSRTDEWHPLATSSSAHTPPEAPPTPPPAPAPPVFSRIAISPAPPPMTANDLVAIAPAWVVFAPRHEAPPVPAVSTAGFHSHQPQPLAEQVISPWTPEQSFASEVSPALPPGLGAAGESFSGRPASLEVGLSSEAAVPVPSKAGRDFWFQVNAEVVIYGSTERDARVTIGGRPVRLKPDGSFSFRFSLPDGNFSLPMAAVAADGYGLREAVFHLSRQTEKHGQVGQHPQNPVLRPPLAENAVPG